MRVPVMVLTACAALAGGLSAQTPSRQELESEAVRAMRRVGSMSQLMVHLIYPTSDAVFYIQTRTPATFEIPKSVTNALPSTSIMMFAGFTSRWMTPRPRRWA